MKSQNGDGIREIAVDRADTIKCKICAFLLLGKTRAVESLEYDEVVRKHDNIVHVISHGTGLVGGIITPLINQITIDAGAGHRRFHLPFSQAARAVPGLSHIMGLASGAVVNLSKDEILTYMADGRLNDWYVTPEGQNAFVGRVDAIKPFVSARFVEIALLTGSPIRLFVHAGTERSVLQVNAKRLKPLLILLPPSSYRLMRYKKLDFLRTFDEFGGVLSIPYLRWRTPIKYSQKIYVPGLTRADLDCDREEKEAKLWAEADRIRDEMTSMLERLEDER